MKIDFEVKDHEGRTPMHYLYQSWPKTTVEEFLKAAKEEYNIEFDLTVKDCNGLAPPQMKKNELDNQLKRKLEAITEKYKKLREEIKEED